MKRYFSTLVLLFIFLSFSLSSVSAHDGHDHQLTNLQVTTIQEPLSPFVGETVKITFVVTDEKGQPMKELAGDMLIKKVIVKEFTDKTSSQEETEIYKKPTKTDVEGVVVLDYAFNEEGLYEAEFVWGDEEKENASHQIFARDPSSYFLPQELGKRIWLFIGIALAGIVVGAFGTFILLTTSLHPKK